MSAARPAGSFTARAWEATAEVRSGIDALPFLRELADGTLAAHAFAHYLEQDAIYLAGYARALALLAARAADPAGSAFWARAAATAATEEGALHADLLADPALGAAARERGGARAEPSPTTLGYVSYLVATAATAPYPVAVAAVLPCFWVYADVGARLWAAAAAPDGDGSAHPYRRWVEAYGDPAFQAGAEGACDAADACTDPADAEALTAFITATRWELLFWSAAHAREAWPASPQSTGDGTSRAQLFRGLVRERRRPVLDAQIAAAYDAAGPDEDRFGEAALAASGEALADL